MHERISVHQMCFAGAGLSDYVRQCRTLGARRIGFISPALLAPGGLAEARSALAAATSRWKPSRMSSARATSPVSATSGASRANRSRD